MARPNAEVSELEEADFRPNWEITKQERWHDIKSLPCQLPERDTCYLQASPKSHPLKFLAHDRQLQVHLPDNLPHRVSPFTSKCGFQENDPVRCPLAPAVVSSCIGLFQASLVAWGNRAAIFGLGETIVLAAVNACSPASANQPGARNSVRVRLSSECGPVRDPTPE